MRWVFELYREYLTKTLTRQGVSLSEQSLENAFREALEGGFVKILVQEPWMGTIRFKALSFHQAQSPEALALFENPMDYLRNRFGGGKFKINLYEGMNFVATRNFKPEGEPRWVELPELTDE